MHQWQAYSDVLLSCVFHQDSKSLWPMRFKNSTRKEPRFWFTGVVTLGGDDEGVVGIVELICGDLTDYALGNSYNTVNFTLLCSNALQVFSN